MRVFCLIVVFLLLNLSACSVTTSVKYPPQIEVDTKHKYKKHKKHKEKSLPPGLAKNQARGKPLPPGWQKKLRKGSILDYDVYRHREVVVPVDSKGLVTIRVGGKLIRLIDATREVIEVLE